jgi:hypothetical protein
MENRNVNEQAGYSLVLETPIPFILGDWSFKTLESASGMRDLSYEEISRISSQEGVPTHKFPKITTNDVHGIYFPFQQRILSVPKYIDEAKKMMKQGIKDNDPSTKQEYIWRLNQLKEGLASVFSDYKPHFQKTTYGEMRDIIHDTEGIVMGGPGKGIDP